MADTFVCQLAPLWPTPPCRTKDDLSPAHSKTKGVGMASIQSFLLVHKDNPANALRHAGLWAKEKVDTILRLQERRKEARLATEKKAADSDQTLVNSEWCIDV